MRQRTPFFFKAYKDFFGPDGAQRLSHRAQAMLIALMVQYIRGGNGYEGNNGSLKLTAAFLPHWSSADLKQKARDELIAEGFIVEVSKGRRPNRASLYAITCEALDPHPDHNPELVENFVLGAWRGSKSEGEFRSNRGRNLLRVPEKKSENSCSEYRSNPFFAAPVLGVEEAAIAPVLGAIGHFSLLRYSETFLDICPFCSGVGAGEVLH